MATRRWLGTINTLYSNNGNWDDGAGGAVGNPAITDNLVFGAAATKNCEIDVVNRAGVGVDFTGFNRTIKFTKSLSISGGVTLDSGTTYEAGASPSDFHIYGTSSTIVWGGAVIPAGITVKIGNNANLSWTASGTLTCVDLLFNVLSSTNIITINGGTINVTGSLVASGFTTGLVNGTALIIMSGAATTIQLCWTASDTGGFYLNLEIAAGVGGTCTIGTVGQPVSKVGGGGVSTAKTFTVSSGTMVWPAGGNLIVASSAYTFVFPSGGVSFNILTIRASVIFSGLGGFTSAEFICDIAAGGAISGDVNAGYDLQTWTPTNASASAYNAFSVSADNGGVLKSGITFIGRVYHIYIAGVVTGTGNFVILDTNSAIQTFSGGGAFSGDLVRLFASTGIRLRLSKNGDRVVITDFRVYEIPRITLKASIVYIVSSLLRLVGIDITNQYVDLLSDTASTKAVLTVNGSNQVAYVKATDMNSSNGSPVSNMGGLLTRTLNWLTSAGILRWGFSRWGNGRQVWGK